MTADVAHPSPKDLWWHRRRMAYGGLTFSAFCIMLGMLTGALVPAATAEAVIVPLATTGFWGGLVPMATYMGNTAIGELANLRRG